MEIKTRDFGTIEISADDILSFPSGLYAFEEERQFVLLCDEESPVCFLQSVSGENPRFIVFRAEDIEKSYCPKVPEELMGELGAESSCDLNFFVIAVIPDDIREGTVNLRSPIVINFKKRLAAQTVLEEGEYNVRRPLFDDTGEEPC